MSLVSMFCLAAIYLSLKSLNKLSFDLTPTLFVSKFLGLYSVIISKNLLLPGFSEFFGLNFLQQS